VTVWCNAIGWEEKGVFLEEFHKGEAIGIIAKVGLNRWTGNDGVERVTPELTVWSIYRPLWKKRESAQSQTKPATGQNTGRDLPPPAAGGGPSEGIPFMYSR
jgi:single-stranded DNA-binding protein